MANQVDNITMEKVEKCLDFTIKRAKDWEQGKIDDNTFNEDIDLLRDVLKQGVRAGLYCNEKRIREKFNVFQNIVSPYVNV